MTTMSTFQPCLDLKALLQPKRNVDRSRSQSESVPRAQEPTVPRFYWRRQMDQKRYAHAVCEWWEAREDIEEQLGLNKQLSRKQSGASCVVGFVSHAGELIQLDDMQRIQEGQEVIVRIVPKQVVSPPKKRRLQVDTVASETAHTLSEEERVRMLCEGTAQPPSQPYWASLPIERVGDAPPEHYVCRKCSHRGHYANHCPWKSDNESRPTTVCKRPQRPCGIPRCFLRFATEEEKRLGQVFVADDGKIYSNNHALT